MAAPGGDLPFEATFDYRERFERERSLWRLIGYRYEYREEPPPGRLAYHWHDDSFHAHCVDRRYPGRDHHYRAHAMSLFEAHEEFEALFARGEPVSCDHLRPARLRIESAEAEPQPAPLSTGQFRSRTGDLSERAGRDEFEPDPWRSSWTRG